MSVTENCGIRNGSSAVSQRTEKKIGTSEDAEGKVHLESNAWAVLSGAADVEQRKTCDGFRGISISFTPYGILLNAPSYTVPDDDIGFVTERAIIRD